MTFSLFPLISFGFCLLISSQASAQPSSFVISDEDQKVIILSDQEFYHFTVNIESESAEQLPEPSQQVEVSQKLTVQWAASQGLVKPESINSMNWFPLTDDEVSTLTCKVAINTLPMKEYDVTLLHAKSFNPNGDGMLSGYFIGLYPNQFGNNVPAPVARNRESYTPPTEFYPQSINTNQLLVTRTKTLGELSPAPLPNSEVRYFAITPKALQFLRLLEDKLQKEGKNPNTLKILRGYISPQERLRMERLGITLAEFTRFQYGDAFALIIDANDDFKMDDLNGDGSSTIADVETFSTEIRVLLNENNLAGGIGICAEFEGPDHLGTPFLHVDLRGWNLLWREE